MKVNFQYVINLKKKNYDFLTSYILRDILIVLKYLNLGNKKIENRQFTKFKRYLIKLQEKINFFLSRDKFFSEKIEDLLYFKHPVYYIRYYITYLASE